MPRGDRTGPDGMGPMTGRAAGYCGGFERPGFMNGAGGRGMGRGFGFGRGMGFGRSGRGFFRGGFAAGPYYADPYYAAPPAPYQDREQELRSLKDQAEYLKQNMEHITKRITELESDD